jgi:glycosyltransferase involved in cell wall biosynthesis
MNIVVMTPCWPQLGKPNGIATYYANLVPALCELGHNVKIMTDVSDFKDDRVVRISFKSTFIDKLFCRVMGKIFPGYETYYYGSRAIVSTIKSIEKNNKIDVFQMEDSFGWHYHVQKKCNFPVVLRLHGPHYLNNFEENVSTVSRHRLVREERAFRCAKFVTSPSENVLSLTKKKYGASWQLDKVVPNSISIPSLAKRWSIHQIKKYQILFVGRFDSHKGADILLSAVEKLYSDFSSVKLIFIGPDRGIFKEGVKYALSDYVKKYHPALPVESVLVFLGEQDKETISAYRVESHVTVISSRYETFGNVALEALSYGSPLVCSNAGALPEIVVDKKSGLLFESESGDDLADKVKSLFENEVLCEEVARGASERAEKYFSPVETAQELVSFFQLATTAHVSG